MTEKQAHKKERAEIKKYIHIIFGSVVCTLWELYGFRKKRCLRFLYAADEVLNEQYLSSESMPEICERETGMVMTRGNESYKSVFLLDSSRWHMEEKKSTEPRRVHNIEEMMPWMPQIYEACALIAMHREFGWGNRKRLPELLECMEGIRNEERNADYYMNLLKYNYGTELEIRR